MDHDDLSIIIVSYNTQTLLRQCLLSVQAYAPQAQVIVVDNASSDGSPEMVRMQFPDMELIETGGNIGFARANNAGLERATGRAVVLLNSDTMLEDDTLLRCAKWLYEHPCVGAVSPLLIGVDDQPQSCVYTIPTFAIKFREALRHAPYPEPTEGNRWLAGTALMLRRAALDSVGGQLESSLFMYWEDADLSARLREAGWELAVFEDGHVRHHGGASGGGPDACRRPNLYAWWLYGKHAWFARHRPAWESGALWLLDAVDVFRKLVRGVVRGRVRREWQEASIVAGILGRRLLGISPPWPEIKSGSCTPIQKGNCHASQV